MKKALSQQEIERLYTAAAGGDASAAKYLGEVSSYYAKKANERLRDFAKEGIHSESELRARYWLSEVAEKGQINKNGLFGRSKNLTPEQAYELASEARTFLYSKTGTPKKEKERRDKVYKKLQDEGYAPTERDGEDAIVADRKKFDAFLKSSAWRELKSAFGYKVLNDISDRVSQGYDIENLLNAYKYYEEGEIDMLDLVSGWLSI